MVLFAGMLSFKYFLFFFFLKYLKPFLVTRAFYGSLVLEHPVCLGHCIKQTRKIV